MRSDCLGVSGVLYHTSFFQKHAALGHDNGHVAVDIALAMFVEKGYGDIGIRYANNKWHTKDAAGFLGLFCGVVLAHAV